MKDPISHYHDLLDEYHRTPPENQTVRRYLLRMANEARAIARELGLKSSRVRWSYSDQPKSRRSA